MTVNYLQANMSRGSITPYMRARVDNELYQAGVAEARNWISMRYGGVTRAPGNLYLGACENTTETTALIPFRFNRNQVYAIEFADEKILFWTNSGQVMNGGSPYEIVSPYAAADVRNIQYWQSGDVLYLACDGYAPRTLTRSSETSWAFAEHTTKDGPFLDLNDEETTLKLADTGHLVATMTSNTAPSPLVASSSVGGSPFYAFNRDELTGFATSVEQGWIKIDLGSGNAAVSDKYTLYAPQTQPERQPTRWEIQGSNDDTNWTVLDRRDGEEGWAEGEIRFYEFTNKTAYRYYRFYWRAVGSGGAGVRIHRLDFNKAAASQTAFNCTASSTTGINGGDGFQTTDVGRHIRIYGSDGKWRWLEIIARTSTTVVTVKMHGFALPETNATPLWRMGAWGEEPGYPKAVGAFEDRAVWANTDTEPFSIWASINGGYDNHRISDPLVSDDSVTIKPTVSTGVGLDPVRWIAGGVDILIGAEGALKAVGARDAGEAFGPENVRQLKSTPTPTGGLLPLFDNNSILYFDTYGKRLYEAIYSSEADGYVAQEISVLNEHLLRNGVVRYAYQSSPHRVIWCVTTDGSLVSITYDRDQRVFAATERTVDGVVMDVLSLPGTGKDDIFMVVQRTINSATVQYMELLSDYYQSDTHDYPVYYDCAAVKEGSGITSISDASHLEGETVGVWVDGEDVGDATVSSGSFTLPGNGTSGDTVVYGLRMTGYLELLRPANWGQRSGVALGPQVRVVDGYVDVYETAGLKFGTLETQDSWAPEVPYSGAPTLETGALKIPGMDDQYQNGGVFVATTDRGYPATILAVTVGIEGAD